MADKLSCQIYSPCEMKKLDQGHPPPVYDRINWEDAGVLPQDPGVDTSFIDEEKESPPPSYPHSRVPSEENIPDPWKACGLEKETVTDWKDLTLKEKVQRVLGWIVKPILLLTLLYIFICSLGLMSSAFRLVGGRTAGKAFSSSALIQNPVAGLMIGIVATVLVQSSSTSTSIVVTMVASGILEVRYAIPIIMGANIGTSVTNTIVSLMQSGDKEEFRRAFGGATVHDMFNWLSVLVLLPIEMATGYLYHLTSVIVKSNSLGYKGGKVDFLKAITKPVLDRIIKLDKKVISAIALGKGDDYAHRTILKKYCSYEEVVIQVNGTVSKTVMKDLSSVLNQTSDNGVYFAPQIENVTGLVNKTIEIPGEKCSFLFNRFDLGDTTTGVILLMISLLVLCLCLIAMVKLLNSILKGHICKIIKKTLNADFPGCLKHLTGYIAILIGAAMTILVQSSSVFTSALTPLVGIGVIEIERMYPLTLGSNIGTTGTSILAALAASGNKFQPSLQIALCHLFFNISGILLYYPIPAMRFPIRMAKVMGNTTAKYRWFAVMYLVFMFVLLPGVLLGLSMWGPIQFWVFLGTALTLVLVVGIISILQAKRPSVLPERLRTWHFLPECLRSLAPVDRLFTKLLSIFKKCCPCKSRKPNSKQPEPHIIPDTQDPEAAIKLLFLEQIERTPTRIRFDSIVCETV